MKQSAEPTLPFSPASGYLEEGLDLNKLVVRDRATTYFGRVSGDSMRDAGIFDGDLLVIDRGLKGQSGDVALCMLNGEFAVKRLLFQGEKILLQSEGSRSSSIEVTPEDDFQIWGVITYSFRRLRKRKEG